MSMQQIFSTYWPQVCLLGLAQVDGENEVIAQQDQARQELCTNKAIYVGDKSILKSMLMLHIRRIWPRSLNFVTITLWLLRMPGWLWSQKQTKTNTLLPRKGQTSNDFGTPCTKNILCLVQFEIFTCELYLSHTLGRSVGF